VKNKDKDKLLQNREKFVSKVRGVINEERKEVEEIISKPDSEINQMTSADQDVFFHLRQLNQDRDKELDTLYDAPFFKRMRIRFKDEENERDIHIAKFGLMEQGIYSWVAPVAQLRFEEIGEVSYERPKAGPKEGVLSESDDLMITDGKISYYSHTSSSGKELVYQKHFTDKPKEFGLSEIVRQMEKLQDTIIRAGHVGPLLISGPAGSGKTTVALHRVAYLKQAPETHQLYADGSCVVLVQDKSSVEYFAKLLPDLGIYKVEISTFADWGRRLLNLGDEYDYVERYGKSFNEKNEYEYWKVQEISNLNQNLKHFKDPYTVLKSVYKEMPKQYRKLLETQRAAKILDKQDITLLLKAYKASKGEIQNMQPYYKRLGDSRVEKKYRKVKTKYSFILVDEFQNYTPDQLSLVREVLDPELRSITYVGDLGQQTHIGSIQDWSQIGENFGKDRQIVLDRVYRNAPAILNLLKDLGYEVNVETNATPDEKQDVGVADMTTNTEDEEFKAVQEGIEGESKKTIGVVAFEEGYLDKYKSEFATHDNVHILPVNKVQGLEFEIVYLVGLDESLFNSSSTDMPQGYAEAYRDTVKDYLYVACTRAIHTLHIHTRTNVKSIINKLTST